MRTNPVTSVAFAKQGGINHFLERVPKRVKKSIGKIPGARRLARALGLTQNYAIHRRFLLEMLPKNSVGAEIGVNLGNFAKQILEVVQPAELHLIDPWKHETAMIYRGAIYGGIARGQQEMDERHASVLSRFAQEIDAHRVIVHREESAKVLNEFPNDYFDWVYIDGNHLYEYVTVDLTLSCRTTKIGGYVTGDDYSHRGWWKGGVTKAVDEFITTGAVELAQIRNEQFMLRRIH